VSYHTLEFALVLQNELTELLKCNDMLVLRKQPCQRRFRVNIKVLIAEQPHYLFHLQVHPFSIVYDCNLLRSYRGQILRALYSFVQLANLQSTNESQACKNCTHLRLTIAEHGLSFFVFFNHHQLSYFSEIEQIRGSTLKSGRFYLRLDA
jgi:hypothetical protein